MSPNLQARDQSRGPARSSMGPGRDVRDGQGRLCLPVCQAASHQPSGTVSRGLVRTDLDCRTRFGSDIHEPVGWLARDNGMGSYHCLSRKRREAKHARSSTAMSAGHGLCCDGPAPQGHRNPAPRAQPGSQSSCTAPCRVTQTSDPHPSHQTQEPGQEGGGPLGGSCRAPPVTVANGAEALRDSAGTARELRPHSTCSRDVEVSGPQQAWSWSGLGRP